MPGGGLVRFARSALRVRVAVGGAVFCGWDGAEPEPSYGLERCPDPDTRAVIEPDKGGWRVVSERVTVVVSRQGAVEFRTPGGVLLRRDLPPRWWDPVSGQGNGHRSGGGPRWVQRSETAPDAAVFGLGGRTSGPRLPEGAYRLWNTELRAGSGSGDGALPITMPVQLVVADAGSHLVFHDNSWDGWVSLRDGEEGAGSGHDRASGCELRMGGGPLRYWVLTGSPSRILSGWTALSGRPALPPRWALGHHRAHHGAGELEVRQVAAGYRERGLPLAALHLDTGHLDRGRPFTVDSVRFPDLPGLARELGEQGVRLVSITDPAVRDEPGSPVFDSGAAVNAYVRNARGDTIREVLRPGEVVFPDFTASAVRRWWAGLYQERVERGFAGVWHDMNEPVSFAAFGDSTLPRSARHSLDGRGGDHREAHNVYGLLMARACHEGLAELRPGERPFLISRSGWTGMQRYAGTVSGDVTSGWPGLRASLSLVLGLGLCGVPYSGPDVGGFTDERSAELYLRRLQMAAFLPFFRTRSAESAGGGEPWTFGPEILEHMRTAMRQRERLTPYLYTLAHLARSTGSPYVRPLWWNDTEDRKLRDCGDAFLLGDALLVAPVLEPESDVRSLRLPQGRWYDTATGAAHTGPGQVLVDAPLERIPVLARAGAVLPVAGAQGRVELEVWAPEPGRTGGGLLVSDEGDGWGEPLVERFTARLVGAEVVVERGGSGEVGYPVRVRGA
jgi:alpha-glucosidase